MPKKMNKLKRFTVYMPPDFVRAVKIAAAQRGTSAGRLMQDSLLKDRMLRGVLPRPEELLNG